MGNFFTRHSRLAEVLVVLTSLVMALVVLEVTIRIFWPCRYVLTVGHTYSDNAQKYGWGYDPYELINVLDADTGQIYSSRANNHGWRDRDRHYENPTNAFRILVLGDSNTFGARIPADKIYTRVLEDALVDAGYNAEVISMAYGGWGTDQQLEALSIEGPKFKPDLVIAQFSINDLSDNAYFHYILENKAQWSGRPIMKPFYYTLDENQHLIKKPNPYFADLKTFGFRRLVGNYIRKVEIRKWLHFIHMNYQLRKERAKYKSNKFNDYYVSKAQLEQISTALDLSPSSGLHEYLKENMDQSLSYEQLTKAIALHGHEHNKEVVLRILEDRWFHRAWSRGAYTPQKADPTTRDWRLYFALMDQMKRQAKLIGADLAIFLTSEIGGYQWEVAWHRIRDDAQSRENYFDHVRVIRAYMKEKGIADIDNTVAYERARNDPHPNIAGHKAMAADIYKFVLANYEERISPR